MKKEFDIITFGSATVDVFVDAGIHQRNGLLCLPAGQKLEINDLKFSTGGGGTNSAAALAKLGFNVGYIGKVGAGHNGELILKDLNKRKVTFLGSRGNEHTGYSVILDSIEKDRTILTYKGASDSLKLKEISSNFKTNWFYFSSLLGESLKTQKHIAKLAKKRKIPILFNPSSYQLNKGISIIKDILKATDILILNYDEARILIPRGDILTQLYSYGPRIVIVTDGEHAIEAFDGNYWYKARPYKVKCAERTGAGDAFSSGFLAGYMKTERVEYALMAGIANAASVIQIPGAKNGLLTWDEIERIIKKNPIYVSRERYL